MRNSSDELGIRVEIVRNVLIWAITYLLIIALRAEDMNQWQPCLVVFQQMMLTYSMIVMPCNNSNNPFACCWNKGKVFPNLSDISNSQISPESGGSDRSSHGRRSVSSHYSVSGSWSDVSSQMSMSFFDQGLDVLLDTDKGMAIFSEHCAKEFSVENIRFWLAVEEFRKFEQLRNTAISERREEEEEEEERERLAEDKGKEEDNAAGEEAATSGSAIDAVTSNNDDDGTKLPAGEKRIQVDEKIREKITEAATQIYGDYVKPGSETQINVPSKMQKAIKAKIDAKEISIHMFDAAQQEIFNLMSRDSYQRFLKANHRRAMKNAEAIAKGKRRGSVHMSLSRVSSGRK